MRTINQYKNRFNQLLESTMGNVKPLLNEEETTIINKFRNKVKNKVASEGLKNLTPDMMAEPAFSGSLDRQTIKGNFKNVNYEWDCSGIENVPSFTQFGKSGFPGMIIIDTIENFIEDVNLPIEDGKPNTPALAFKSDRHNFLLYTTNSGKVKCLSSR